MTVLHAHVSRLRRLVEPDRPSRAPATILRSTETGYVLDLRGHALDVDRFVQLLDAGRSALNDGDPAEAKAQLSEALALWRGPAYGEFADHPTIVAAAADLEDQRLTGAERLAEARLQLGEHAELVGELETRVREHPYREHAWAQLVLALYRAGRQADALATYQRCRRRLVDELGIEPGPALQELNEAVLLQSPTLDWRSPREVTPAAPRTTRATRPPTPRTSFVGRGRELAEVKHALEAHRLVTVTGSAGVGKTRLAVEAAIEAVDVFHHGVAFCDLVGVPGDQHVAAAIADAVGVEELVQVADDPLLEHLAGREQLLVVDNADHTLEAVARLADRLLTGCPRLRLLVTSREPLRAAGERLVPLDPLSATTEDDPAIRLFTDRAELSAPTVPLDTDQVVTLCRRIDGLPLAIELAASRLRSVPLDHLVTGLDDRLSSLADTPPPRGSTDHRTLREVIDWSVELLDEDQRALLRRLAVFSGGCTSSAARIVCEIGPDPVEALGALVERSLVQLESRESGPRYRLLETIRADGLVRLGEHDELDRFRDRHLRWCLSLVPADPGHGQDPADVEPLAAEIDNVVAALAWSLDGMEPASGARLAVAAAPFWVHAGRFGEGRRWLERAVAATPSEAHEHRQALRWLGWILARQGDIGTARSRLGDATRLAEAAGDDTTRRDAQLLLGAVEIEAGDLESGEARLRPLDEPMDEATERRRRAHRAHALGIRAVHEGKREEAVALLRQAAQEARDARMWHTLVRVLTSLSQSESGRHRIRPAEGALAEALTVARQHRLLGLMPRLLGVRAIQTVRHGDRSEARSLFEESLAAARSVGDRRVEMITLTNLGLLSLLEGQPASALPQLEAALDLARKAADERQQLMASAALAEAVAAANHDTDRALAIVTDTVTRSQRAGLRIATISAMESAAYALVDRAAPEDLRRAATYLGAATAEREALEWPHDTEDSTVSRTRAAIEAAIGAAATQRADREGRRLGLDAVAEELLAHGTTDLSPSA